MQQTMPVIFVAHGAPMLLDDAVWMKELAAWAATLPRPQAILAISAHWQQHLVTVGATQSVPLIYDFYGFPERYYRLEYPAPGAPQLAEALLRLLQDRQIAVAQDAERGLDHGTYVPLMAMYPEAKIPVLQISMPELDARALFQLGAALAPLRHAGVLIYASGFLTHNMQYAFRPGTPEWALGFDRWVEEALQRFDVEALIHFQQQAPGAHIALPTWEHFAPLLIAIGAASEASPRITFPITGWWMEGAFSRRSVQFD